jgi:hypothetical protein
VQIHKKSVPVKERFFRHHQDGLLLRRGI